MSTTDLRCSEHQLVLLRPLDELSAPERLAVTRWLWEHGITPSAVAVGLGIERDDLQTVLVWREEQSDGSIVKRWRFAPHDGDARWPAPFPQVLRGSAAARGTHLERTAATRA